MAAIKSQLKVRDHGWSSNYEQLRAVALAGRLPDDDSNVRRLARFGMAGLVSARPAWQVVVSETPEPRWGGDHARQASLVSAYGLLTGGIR